MFQEMIKPALVWFVSSSYGVVDIDFLLDTRSLQSYLCLCLTYHKLQQTSALFLEVSGPSMWNASGHSKIIVNSDASGKNFITWEVIILAVLTPVKGRKFQRQEIQVHLYQNLYSVGTV